MKASDFSAILQAFAETLASVGAAEMRYNLVEFAKVFDARPSDTVAFLMKRLASIRVNTSGQKPTLGEVADALAALRPLLAAVAKPPVKRDIELVQRLLQAKPLLGVRELAASLSVVTAPTTKPRGGRNQTVQSELVNSYLSLLQGVRGDESRFWSVFKQLESDTRLGNPDIAALAKAYSGHSVRSKADGLKKIANVQHQINVVRAKTAATAGRSAA
jgi:hypothetical protein